MECTLDLAGDVEKENQFIIMLHSRKSDFKSQVTLIINFFFLIGAYGTVFKAKDVITGNIVALKTMRFALTEDGVPMAILREISLLKQLERFDHPNIVRYVQYYRFSPTSDRFY